MSVIADNNDTQANGRSTGIRGARAKRAKAASASPPGYSARPVRHSSSTSPSAYTSDAGPTVDPRTCSGERYPAVPTSTPDVVTRVTSATSASPKSAR